MKKITAFAIVLLLLFSLCIAAFADLGDAEFENWSVVCGPAGFSFVDVPYIDTDPNLDLHDYLRPGTKLWVHEYDRDTKKYLLVIDRDSGHKIKGCGFVYVTDAQLQNSFIGDRKPAKEDYGMKLDKEVNCIVTPRIGLVLRQGPDRNFPSYTVIPQNTKLTYQYVCEYDDYNWGYVTYKGQCGWCCIDYTEEIEPETEPPADTTAEATTEPAAETTAETTTETTAAATDTTAEPASAGDAAVPDPTEQTVDSTEPAGFFGNTKTVILVCCLGAVVLALTAVVLLLIIKRRKQG